MSHLSFYEPNHYHKLYYSVLSMYKVAEDLDKARVIPARMTKFTTKPDVEVRWKV